MSLRKRTRPGLGIIEPCLPSPAKMPPSGPGWLHEIKHDGFRIMARRDGAGVRLFTRHGHDFTARFPLAAGALAALPGRSFLIDGEAIVCDDKGLAVFELIRRARNGGAAVLCAFDLIELDGTDLRRTPIEHRKQKLARLVRTPRPGIVLNEHLRWRGRHRVQIRLQARLRGHCVKAARLVLPIWPRQSLAESEEPKGARSEA
jgi:bifunctional non-homologous end joining protein LigD